MAVEYEPANPTEAARQLEHVRWKQEFLAAKERREAEEMQSPSGTVVY